MYYLFLGTLRIRNVDFTYISLSVCWAFRYMFLLSLKFMDVWICYDKAYRTLTKGSV